MSTLTAVEVPVFIKRKHELANLLKALEKGSVDAVDLIVSTMNSTSEDVTLKMKFECAKSLLDLQIKVAAEISKDSLVRQIAEIKAKGLSRPLELQEGRTAPMIDFNTIQEIS